MLVISWIFFVGGIFGFLCSLIIRVAKPEEHSDEKFGRMNRRTLTLVLYGIIGIWLIDWDMIPWII
jgi:hypothetical protein